MKRILTALLAATLIVCTAPTANAADRLYPVEVREYEQNGVPHIEKVYKLSLTDDPGTIPVVDFDRDGYSYHLLDVTRICETGTETREHVETVTKDSDTGKLDAVLPMLDPQLEVTTEDGCTGILTLDEASVKVEAKGYRTGTKDLVTTRTYTDLVDSDLSLIPKTVQEGSTTLTLADVQWTEGITFTAAATYTGTRSVTYATGYTVTAEYRGEVSRTICEGVTYTAIFTGTPIVEAPASNELSMENEKTDKYNPLWLLVPAALCIAALTGYIVLRIHSKKKKGRNFR